MALKQKIEINNTGVFADYHRVTPLDFNTLRIESWLTTEDRRTGKQPVYTNTCNISFTRQSCRKDTVPEETQVDDINKRAAYAHFKALNMPEAEDV